ncbi:Cro/Cl family transcriptional regulator [Sporanaerobium hydrogeniformans]|uniref:Cro/Cl family transcriptional regulator n=1 Tax=Sporanaerobium hydrogeniformans TaxID=3072179 RepID=A0AC61D9F2_9FIRM|nr:helix-turn-helix transcriptional regulator [Sporanaerobium hydrogeniformans]PHV69232.1 Cro/Cl family transcriptional regulator [Sporanaerobium hydrogeniformans]
MNDRVRFLRKNFKKTQKEFGEIIGLKQTSIADIEKGKVNITDRTVKLICSEFNVNEEWLRTGEGAMFNETTTMTLDEYAQKNNLSPLELDIMKAYMDIDRDTRLKFLSQIKNIFFKHATHDNEIAATVTYEAPSVYPDIEEELERYRIELEAEKKGKILSALEGQKHA